MTLNIAPTDLPVSALDLLTDMAASPDMDARLRYDHPDRSYSPFWSNIGLSFGAEQGIEALHLYYNRHTLSFGLPAVTSGVPVGARKADVLGVSDTALDVAFFSTDSFLIESAVPVTLRVFSDPALRVITDTTTDDGLRHVHAMARTRDPRDPDKEVPVLLSLRVLCGRAEGDTLLPLADNRICAAIRVEVLTIDPARATRILLDAPSSITAARAAGRAWLQDALGNFALHPADASEASVLARALVTLLFNTTAAPGLMAGRLASFPSRGGYPTHFLWDACFHTLALEYMHPRLARDALLLLSDCMRPDGLMPHFICSTWIRPDASQPPLFGWAVERLVEQTKDLALAEATLPKMLQNTEWWLTQRMTSTGLVACFDPFETGWDDTPRLDEGPIIACDMNAYLLMQMRSAARLAGKLGKDALAQDLTHRADRFAARLVAVLHDPVANRFHDVSLQTGQPLSIMTPACFLPLLGDLPLPHTMQRSMLTRDLLDPARLCGRVPFPSVAYDEPSYLAHQMWRGPMWPPIYWLLLELLKKFGMDVVRSGAAKVLYQIILSDENLHEYFNSQTADGLGFPQQGWTAAIFLRLHVELTGAQG